MIHSSIMILTLTSRSSPGMALSLVGLLRPALGHALARQLSCPRVLTTARVTTPLLTHQNLQLTPTSARFYATKKAKGVFQPLTYCFAGPEAIISFLNVISAKDACLDTYCNPCTLCNTLLSPGFAVKVIATDSGDWLQSR